MIRTCDGTDETLSRPVDTEQVACGSCPDGRRVVDRYEPCACGLTFDDVDRSVIWPHVRFTPKPTVVGGLDR